MRFFFCRKNIFGKLIKNSALKQLVCVHLHKLQYIYFLMLNIKFICFYCCCCCFYCFMPYNLYLFFRKSPLVERNYFQTILILPSDFPGSEAATQWCSQEKVLCKYATNLQENSHAESYFATLLKSHFGMGVLL